MGLKFEVRSRSEVETTADALAKAAARLVQISLEMRQLKMDDIILAWAQRQWDAIDLVIELTTQSELMAQAQFLSKSQGRRSIYESAMERSAKKASKKITPAVAETPKRPRGRPRKK